MTHHAENMPGHAPEGAAPISYYSTEIGQIYHGDSIAVLGDHIGKSSVDLIMTSPPFGLVRKKEYGNASSDEYLKWFEPFAQAFKDVLKPNGSLVIDIGGAWIPGQPTRSLYHFKLLIMLCEQFGFHLCQEFYWWNPSKLPTPAEWVTVRRIRVKDAVNCVWWLSLSPWPRASNRRVLQPYSPSMRHLLKNGYTAKVRPSGHDISERFSIDNGAAIPPNLIALPNTESNSYYLRYCQQHNIKPHPARFPTSLPEYFIRMLTEPGDLVVDPFAGSCVTGEVSERLRRRWVCSELSERYLYGALGRFERERDTSPNGAKGKIRSRKQGEAGPELDEGDYYRLPRPGLFWNGLDETPLPSDGGQARPQATFANCSDTLGHEGAALMPSSKVSLDDEEKNRQLRLLEQNTEEWDDRGREDAGDTAR